MGEQQDPDVALDRDVFKHQKKARHLHSVVFIAGEQPVETVEDHQLGAELLDLPLHGKYQVGGLDPGGVAVDLAEKHLGAFERVIRDLGHVLPGHAQAPPDGLHAPGGLLCALLAIEGHRAPLDRAVAQPGHAGGHSDLQLHGDRGLAEAARARK